MNDQNIFSGVDPSAWTSVGCTKCGCLFFDQKLMIHKISMFTSPTGKEEMNVNPVLVCSECGIPFGIEMVDEDTDSEHPEEGCCGNPDCKCDNSIEEDNETILQFKKINSEISDILDNNNKDNTTDRIIIE